MELALSLEKLNFEKLLALWEVGRACSFSIYATRAPGWGRRAIPVDV
jgi:hypothetical protein